MQRIQNNTSRNPAVDLFGTGKHGFKMGNRALGDPPSTPGAEWFNAVQETICRAIEEGLGPLDKNNPLQLLELIKAISWGENQTSAPWALASQTRTDYIYLDKYVTDPNADSAEQQIQSAFDAAVGKVLIGSAKTYKTNKLIIPNDVRFVSNGAVFENSVAVTNDVITVGHRFRADKITLKIAGGSGSRGIALNGSNIVIDSINVTATSFAYYAVRTISGVCDGLIIGSINTRNCKAHILLYGTNNTQIKDIEIDGYVTGAYLRDNKNLRIGLVMTKNVAAAATGGPGENAVLLESTVENNSQTGVYIGLVLSNASSEHAVRLGGQLSMTNINIGYIYAKNTASAPNNVSTGGCALKVLGGGYGLDPSKKHTNIRVGTVIAEDLNTNANTVNNCSAVMLCLVDDVSIDTIITRAVSAASSCWIGIFVGGGTSNVVIGKVDIKKAKQNVVQFHYDLDAASNPSDNKIKNITIHGQGSIGESAESACLYFVGGRVNVVNTDISLDLAGGISAARSEALNYEGLYQRNSLKIKYQEGNGSLPPLQLQNEDGKFVVSYTGKFYGSYGSTCSNGSDFTDVTTGIVKRRIAGSWYDEQITQSSSYTPSYIGTANVASITSYRCNYIRVGNMVVVSGVLAAQAAAIGSMEMQVSLPVNSNFTGPYDASGTVTSLNTSAVGAVSSVSGGTKLLINIGATTAGGNAYRFCAIYEIK